MNPLLRAAALAVLVAGCGMTHAQSNPFARFPPAPQDLVNGRWNGIDLERRSNCANPQNDGSRGTYAQFDISADPAGNFLIAQSGITGLNCSYFGRYQADGGLPTLRGTYNCTDGKQGEFETRAIEVTGITFVLQMSIRLTGSETCNIDAILSMARFAP